MFANRDETNMFRAPMVEHFPLENGFTISNVPLEELEVVAPTLKFQVMEAGPTEFLVSYQATDMHRVKLKARGRVFCRFWATKGSAPAETANLAGTRPALLEIPLCPNQAKVMVNDIRTKYDADIEAKISQKNQQTINALLEKAEGIINALSANGSDAGQEVKDSLFVLLTKISAVIQFQPMIKLGGWIDKLLVKVDATVLY
eukprot:226779_1